MTRFKILIADDDVTQHEVLGAYLERSGFDVVHAYDGRQAVDCAGRDRVDLVCLDIRMPGMDGFEVLKALQELAPDLPVLFLSSLDAVHVKIRGLELGADDYIVKPFRKAEVLARVRAALRRSKKYQKLQKTLSGDLEQMGLAEIMQAMELGRKTCHIHVESGPGSITIQEGMLAASQWRGLTGEAALQRLLLAEQGHFSVEFVESTDRGGMQVNAALMDALVAQDEALALLKDVTGLDVPLDISPELSKEMPRDTKPVTARDMLLVLPGDLREAAALISDWWRRGLLQPDSTDEGDLS